MRPYEIGDPELDQRLRQLVRDACGDDVDPDEDIISELLVTGLKMMRDSTDRGDLKLANSALKEMRYSLWCSGSTATHPRSPSSARHAPSPTLSDCC